MHSMRMTLGCTENCLPSKARTRRRSPQRRHGQAQRKKCERAVHASQESNRHGERVEARRVTPGLWDQGGGRAERLLEEVPERETEPDRVRRTSTRRKAQSWIRTSGHGDGACVGCAPALELVRRGHRSTRSVQCFVRGTFSRRSGNEPAALPRRLPHLSREAMARALTCATEGHRGPRRYGSAAALPLSFKRRGDGPPGYGDARTATIGRA
jgi:hypothetical protein